MEQSSSDPRGPFVIGIVIMGVLLIGGIVWAVLSAPSGSGGNTADPNLSFIDDNDPVLGLASAPVTVRIFGDFECPACRAAESGVTHLRQNYADKIRIVWNDFPLPPTTHPKARPAANAARCAEEQGKFWEMHDELYSTQTSWSNSGNAQNDFLVLARRIGLNEDGFRACSDERRHDGKVAADLQEGRANGVNATPTFFVNNVKYPGVLTVAEWDQILKPLLESTATTSSTQ